MDYVFFNSALFVLGLVFGSFANVVIWRFPRSESLSMPGSHCPSCEHPIRWFDNVPVISWVLLRARCRDCGAPISFRYPAVELTTALMWLACGMKFGLSARAIVASAMCYLLLILSAIDFDTLRLPNTLVVVLGGIGVVAVVASELGDVGAAPLTPVNGMLSSSLGAMFVGSLVAGGLSLGIALVYQGVRGRSGFGMGDVKLLIALGPYLGIYNIAVLFLGSILGAMWGVIVAVRHEDGFSAKIPFGPFLALAAIVLAFAGPTLWGWYATLVGLA